MNTIFISPLNSFWREPDSNRCLRVMGPSRNQLLHPARKNSTKNSLRGRGSNSRQFAYKATALPTELPRKERSIRWPSDSPHMEETEMPPRLPRITPRPSVREGFTTACGYLAFTAIPYSGRDIANGHRPVCLVPGITWYSRSQVPSVRPAGNGTHKSAGARPRFSPGEVSPLATCFFTHFSLPGAPRFG